MCFEENVLKEYLTKNNSGEYQLVNHRFTDVDIEVPEGAEMLTKDEGNTLTFWKDKDVSMNVGENTGWLNPSEDDVLSFWDYTQYGYSVLWKREDNEETQEYDVVNKPKHYNSDPSGVQCIELTRCLSFDAGNALKYVFREGNKDASLQELKKAQWYVNDLIEYDVPIAIEGLGDTIEFEDKVKKVLATWSGWKYIFLNALYWNDKQEMKRAIDALVKEAEY